MRTLDTKIRTAQKEHTCNFCGFKIAKCEKYDWQKLVHDGLLYEWKAHLSCCDLASELDMYDYADDGVTQDYFIEHIDEAYSKISKDWDKNFRHRLDTVKQYYKIE